MNEKFEKSKIDLKSDNDIKSEKSNNNYFQVDIMKTLMIILVILDHSTTHEFLAQYGSALWERIAIPGFIVVMGFNLGTSFSEKKITTFKEAYSKEYFISKMKRYIIPYIILYFIQGIINLLVNYYFQSQLIEVFPYDFEGLRLIGFTFFWGPGMWFIPVLFGSILVFPALYIFFNEAPLGTFISCFAIEWFIHYLTSSIYSTEFHFTMFFFTYNIFSFFSGIVMGLWISKDREIFSKNNIIFWIFLPISLICLSVYAFGGYGEFRNILNIFNAGWIIGDYNFLTFPYTAFLFLIILKLFPKNSMNKLSKIIKTISRSTYHILLVQILYFSIIYHFWFIDGVGFDSHPIDYLWFYPLSLLISCSGGIIWQILESKFYKKIDENKIYGTIYKLLFSLAVVFYVIFLFSRYIFFFVYPIP
jgi:hypothetical protein